MGAKIRDRQSKVNAYRYTISMSYKQIPRLVQQRIHIKAPHMNESLTAYQLTTNPEELVFQFNDEKSITKSGWAFVHPIGANIRISLAALLHYPESYVVCKELSIIARVFDSEEHVYLSKERRLEFLDKKWSDYMGTELHVVVGFEQPLPEQPLP